MKKLLIAGVVCLCLAINAIGPSFSFADNHKSITLAGISVALLAIYYWKKSKS